MIDISKGKAAAVAGDKLLVSANGPNYLRLRSFQRFARPPRSLDKPNPGAIGLAPGYLALLERVLKQ
jgi:hypothetical protein